MDLILTSDVSYYCDSAKQALQFRHMPKTVMKS
jgi:hypothetical protein